MKKNHSNLLLRLIIIEKAFLGILAVMLSAGVLSLIHADLEALAIRLAIELNLKADNRFMMLAMEQLVNTKVSTLIGVSVVGFFYAGLNFTEAYGLAMRYRWAEYLTVFATGIFIPFEIHEVLKQPDVIRLGALIINVLIVVFLAKHKELFPRRLGKTSYPHP
jgi:uncharacterized membrane protein (DUF2068 family)